MDCQTLYQSVEEGLDKADEKLLHIYNTPDLRIIMESLLLDETTPEKLYTDLFGLTESEQEQYRKYFFNIPKGIPRLEIYEFINTINDQIVDNYSVQRKTLYNEVFNNGWEFIDYKFNKGRCIDILDYGRTMFKEMLIALKSETRDGVSKKDISKMRSILSLIKSGTILYNEKKKDEKQSKYTQLTLQFVEDIKNSIKMQESENYVQMLGAEVGKFGTINSNIDNDVNRKIKEDIDSIKDKK